MIGRGWIGVPGLELDGHWGSVMVEEIGWKFE